MGQVCLRPNVVGTYKGHYITTCRTSKNPKKSKIGELKQFPNQEIHFDFWE